MTCRPRVLVGNLRLAHRIGRHRCNQAGRCRRAGLTHTARQTILRALTAPLQNVADLAVPRAASKRRPTAGDPPRPHTGHSGRRSFYHGSNGSIRRLFRNTPLLDAKCGHAVGRVRSTPRSVRREGGPAHHHQQAARRTVANPHRRPHPSPSPLVLDHGPGRARLLFSVRPAPPPVSITQRRLLGRHPSIDGSALLPGLPALLPAFVRPSPLARLAPH